MDQRIPVGRLVNRTRTAYLYSSGSSVHWELPVLALLSAWIAGPSFVVFSWIVVPLLPSEWWGFSSRQLSSVGIVLHMIGGLGVVALPFLKLGIARMPAFHCLLVYWTTLIVILLLIALEAQHFLSQLGQLLGWTLRGSATLVPVLTLWYVVLVRRRTRAARHG